MLVYILIHELIEHFNQFPSFDRNWPKSSCLRAKISYWIKKFLPTWQLCEYVVTTRCTESAAETILLWIYQVQLTLLCTVFLRIHNYKWQTFTIGNLILQKWHKITKIVGGIEIKSAISFQFRSIPSCNSISNSNACNSKSNSGIGIAINSNSNSRIDPQPCLGSILT